MRTLEISIHKSSVLMALPDSCVSRARDTPSAKVFTRPLTKSAAAAFRTWSIAFVRIGIDGEGQLPSYPYVYVKTRW